MEIIIRNPKKGRLFRVKVSSCSEMSRLRALGSGVTHFRHLPESPIPLN